MKKLFILLLLASVLAISNTVVTVEVMTTNQKTLNRTSQQKTTKNGLTESKKFSIHFPDSLHMQLAKNSECIIT